MRIGDAYLKYLSSIYLFVTFPSLSEGGLHVSRQRIISNRSLLRNANRVGLPQYIQSRPFTVKAWNPHNFIVYRPARMQNDRSAPENAEQDLEEGECTANDGIHVKTEPLKGDELLEVEAANQNENRSASMNVDREQGEIDEGPGDNDSALKKPNKKRKPKDESVNMQWLGDKVGSISSLVGSIYPIS